MTRPAGGIRRGFFLRAAALLFGLLLAEGMLRVGGIAYPAWDRPTEGLGEWGVARARGWAVGESRQWVELNGEGARDVDHALARPMDVHRVVVLGDSYAAAFEVAREQAFWAVMGERFENECPALAGRSVEVVNLSKRGFGTAEELLVWRRFGARYAPDQVVLAFYAGNDFRNNSPELKTSNRPYFRLEGERLVLDERYAEDPSFRRWIGWRGDLWYGLVKHVRLFQVVRHLSRLGKARAETREALERAERWAAAAEQGGPEQGDAKSGAGRLAVGSGEAGVDDGIYFEPTTPDWLAAWEISERLVLALQGEVESAGARFLLMTLSTAIQVHPDPAVRAAHAKRLGVADLDHPERRFAAFARARGVDWYSAVPALRREAEASGECVHGFPGPWACQGHWNERGHRIAGGILAQVLCAQLESKGGSDALRAAPAGTDRHGLR